MAINSLKNSAELAIALSLIASCQEDAILLVDQRQGGEIVLKLDSKSIKKPCVHGVFISPISSKKVYDNWSITLDENQRSACVSEFIYPKVPNHYSLMRQSTALVAGQQYEVSVIGVGFGTRTTFIREPK